MLINQGVTFGSVQLALEIKIEMKGGFRLLVLHINKDEPPDLISSLLF